MAKVSRRLAVDASVLRSAGAKLGHSSHCTRVLYAVLELGHCAVLCPEIKTEWNKHQSLVAAKWRGSMLARKQITPIDIRMHQQRLNDRLDQLNRVPQTELTALRKDVHMLAAAAHADRMLVSGDHALKTLCDAHLTESVEWLLTLDTATDADRQAQLDRLTELTRPKPYPALPL
nr:hypothetical protein [uncultured Albidiferax sp.]